MKGILLAGGSGKRLYPITKAVSKQLLPIYKKPMIYYPLSVLMLTQIREILIITTPVDQPNFMRLLGNGTGFGINLSYATQNEPKGIAEAFIIGKDFIGSDSVSLVLGDNIFHGQGLSRLLKKNVNHSQGATIFAYQVRDPSRFGVVEFDQNLSVLSLEEKPKNPRSNWAVTGLYFYDNQVVQIAQTLKPSERGELEITDLNKAYIKQENLRVELLGSGFTWLDTGTHDSLLAASQFVSNLENQQNIRIACLEDIAHYNGWLK